VSAVLFLGLVARGFLVATAASSLAPGMYEVEVRLELPNLGEVAPPVIERRCMTAEALASGAAFAILSSNPLARCLRSGMRVESSRVIFAVACPGPNAPSAIATFDLEPEAFRGRIEMNLGGKSMTMTEVQAGRRRGECP
jgi:hypothetical protein